MRENASLLAWTAGSSDDFLSGLSCGCRLPSRSSDELGGVLGCRAFDRGMLELGFVLWLRFGGSDLEQRCGSVL